MSISTSNTTTATKEEMLGRVRNFIERQKALLEKERVAEAEQNSLLRSDDPKNYKTLQTKGLALTGLTVIGITVGLGGKRFAHMDLRS